MIGDRAFDADRLPDKVEGCGTEAANPAKRNRTDPRVHDWEMYRWRHQIENPFAKLKECRAIETRYDKTDESFAAAILLRASVVAAK